MKVAHLFDRYLNSTMSWAYRLIKNTPGVRQVVLSPIVIRNRFFDCSFEFVEDPVQKWFHFPAVKREWDVPKMRDIWNALALRTYFPVYVKSVILRRKIDVLHAHFAHVGVAYMRIARQMQIPLIVSFYGTDYERLPFEQPSYKKWYRQMFEIADFIICEGKNGVLLLAKLGCPAEKIRIVKLGIDIGNIPDFTKKKTTNSLSLIQAATFTETKGFIYTVQAFLLALEDCPNMTLTLVGEKWEKKYWLKVQKLIFNSGHGNKIKVLEFVEDDFHQFLSQFDVFIHPSCYSKLMECEGGAPIVLLDAQAVGLPVISTFHCDIPEEVIHTETGLLSQEKDIFSLKESIVRFYKMEDYEFQQFSRRARKHVFEHYDSDKNSLVMKMVYDEALLSAKNTILN